jgi:hypothetical protein
MGNACAQLDRKPVLITTLNSLASGNSLIFPIISDHNSNFIWGTNVTGATNTFVPRTLLCRARLVFRSDDSGTQFYYFIVVCEDNSSSLIVINQENLEFPDQWYAQDTRVRH